MNPWPISDELLSKVRPAACPTTLPRSMSEQLSPVPEQPPAEKSGLRRTASVVGGGLGCLAVLAGLAIVALIVLAYFSLNPTFWIAVVALIVAVNAYKASKRGR